MAANDAHKNGIRIAVYSALGLILLGFIMYKFMETRSTVDEANSAYESTRRSADEVDSAIGGRVVDDDSNQSASSERSTLEPVVIEGSGHTTSKRFHMNKGLTTAKITYAGEGNFIVELLEDGSGKGIELLANEIGTASFSKAFRLETSGTYLLNVTAEGTWRIEITQ